MSKVFSTNEGKTAPVNQIRTLKITLTMNKFQILEKP